MSDDVARGLEAARALEKQGQTAQAVAAYLRVGAFDEAATALAAVQRFGDAGHLLLNALAVGVHLFGGLDVDKKRLARKAAVYFAQAGDTKLSVEIFLALQEPLRAAEVLQRAGDTAGAARLRAAAGGAAAASTQATRATAEQLERAGQLDDALQVYTKLRMLPDAARCAYNLGRLADAALLFDSAGMHYEAAVCFLKVGDSSRALEALTRIPADHPKYRGSAEQAIKIAQQLRVLDFRLDQFLTRFIADGPQSDAEVEAFYVLAQLYRAHDFIENARELYQKLLARRGPYRDAARLLSELDERVRGSNMKLEAIVREESSFRNAAGRPGGSMAKLAPLAPAAPAAPPAPGGTGSRFQFPDLPPLPDARQTAAAVPAPALAPLPGRPSAVGGASASAGAAASGAPLGARPMPTVGEGTPRDANGDLMPQSIIAGRYRVERVLGHGGMATVYKVYDSELDELVAMKVFTLRNDPGLVSRFKQEVSLSRKLAHPNVVRLYDIGEHDGNKFLTMELLDGRDLMGLIGERPMEVARGLRYLIQACRGLAVAHDAGVIHRDIKPDNFFVTSSEVLKVMDFGIAKGKGEGQKLTVAGFIAGTPAYMSPEQINDFGSVDHRTDLYALGIVAYEVFTGRVPFEAPDTMPLLMKHMTEKPLPPSSHVPGIPPRLDAIILKLLEKDRANRVQSCRDLEALFASLESTVR